MESAALKNACGNQRGGCDGDVWNQPWNDVREWELGVGGSGSGLRCATDNDCPRIGGLKLTALGEDHMTTQSVNHFTLRHHYLEERAHHRAFDSYTLFQRLTSAHTLHAHELHITDFSRTLGQTMHVFN